MNTRQAARAYTTRHAHSESNNIGTDNPSQVNESSQNAVYLIDYPIEKGSCLICHDNLPELDLKVCEHLNDAHNITNIKYNCKYCGKIYENISSIKPHYPACKREQNTNTTNTLTAANTNPALCISPAITNQNALNVPALQCVECYKQQITFTAKDKKGLYMDRTIIDKNKIPLMINIE